VRAGAELDVVGDAPQHRAKFQQQAFGGCCQGVEPTASELVANVQARGGARDFALHRLEQSQHREQARVQRVAPLGGRRFGHLLQAHRVEIVPRQRREKPNKPRLSYAIYFAWRW